VFVNVRNRYILRFKIRKLKIKNKNVGAYICIKYYLYLPNFIYHVLGSKIKVVFFLEINAPPLTIIDF